MAGEQTSYVGDDIKVLVNVIDSTGSHVAANIYPLTTRLNGFSTVPTINTIGTGIYEVVFASVTPAPSEGDRLIAKINGDISGTAWTEYAVPIKIVADERGTDSVVVPTSDITAIKAKTDQLAFTVANQVDANSLTGGTSPADIYTYFTAGANEDAFKADTSTLATSAALSGVETKIDTIDINVDSILVDTATDIPTSIAALNDLSQADVRTAVGLASANLDAQLGDIPNVSEFNARTLVASAYFDPATDTVTTDAASRTASQADVSALATAASISALNNLSSTDVTNAVWDASVSSHNVGGSFGKGLRQVKEGLVSIDGQINDLSATASSFITNLTAAVDDYYNGQTLHFINGSLAGQSQVIRDYNGTSKTITLDSALTSAPSNADEFIVLSTHVHAMSELTDSIWNAASSSYTTAGTFGYYIDAQISSAGGGATAGAIADAVWDEARSGHTGVGTFGYYLDARVSLTGGGAGATAAEIWGAQLADYATSGTFGGRFQEGDRYTNTSANIIYLNQGDSYDGEANPVLSWNVTKDYTSYTLQLEITHRVTGTVLLTKAMTALDETTIQASLSSTDTAFANLTTDADFGSHRYVITATSGSSIDSAVIGAVVIRKT